MIEDLVWVEIADLQMRALKYHGAAREAVLRRMRILSELVGVLAE